MVHVLKDRPSQQSPLVPELATVLAPILSEASDCWIYDVSSTSPLLPLVASIAVQERSRWKVNLGTECVIGYESIWNATSSTRGSIVVLMPTDSKQLRQALAQCDWPSPVTNPATGHTPAAFSFARRRVKTTGVVAVLFWRTNGLQYMDVVAQPDVAHGLFVESWSIFKARGSGA